MDLRFIIFLYQVWTAKWWSLAEIAPRDGIQQRLYLVQFLPRTTENFMARVDSCLLDNTKGLQFENNRFKFMNIQFRLFYDK